MTEQSAGSGKDPIPVSSLIPFLLMAFGLAWGIIALFVVIPQQMAAAVGELSGDHPLYFLAVYAPAIAAILIVVHRTGAKGLRAFLSRALLWRCQPAWYGFLILGVPLLYFAGAAWKGEFMADPFPFPSVRAFLVALALAAVKGPVEEFGWRGLALPLLQRRFAPIWAGAMLGVIWGFWHLPAFLLSGTPHNAWSFGPFFAGSVAVSIILTPMFNDSRGSILLASLVHFQLNNPLWPDAQPYDMVLFVAAAGVVICLNWRALFTRVSAVTQVVPIRTHPDHTKKSASG
ncbi:MAG: CPBP family intramembrane metalloprotease [Bryobacterales bacterium]|nr:CPBP family intramembrane metalloprotease [Bryobacterales bacterium]